MSDLHGPLPEDADGHADVRALLAGLGADEQVPADVADRLDETLAALVADRGPVGRPGAAGDRDTTRSVVPLGGPRARARTRRWAPRLLVAATVAAVVGGIGISIASMGSNPGTAAMSGAGNAARPADSSGTASGSTPGSTPGRAGRTPFGVGRARLGTVPRLSTHHFRRDAARLLASGTLDARAAPGLSAASSPGASTTVHGTAGQHYLGALGGCGGHPGLPPGSAVVPARVDGRPATLVVRATAPGNTRITAWSCRGDRVLATATVPR